MSKVFWDGCAFHIRFPAPLYCTELHKDSISESRAGNEKKSRTDQHKRVGRHLHIMSPYRYVMSVRQFICSFYATSRLSIMRSDTSSRSSGI